VTKALQRQRDEVSLKNARKAQDAMDEAAGRAGRFNIARE
jgi:hypothetical protein